MTYNDLVAQIARTTGITHDRVRAALDALPSALLLLHRDEKVRTPLGVFTMLETRTREILLPSQDRTVQVAPKLVVKLRPGVRLRKET